MWDSIVADYLVEASVVLMACRRAANLVAGKAGKMADYLVEKSVGLLAGDLELWILDIHKLILRAKEKSYCWRYWKSLKSSNHHNHHYPHRQLQILSRYCHCNCTRQGATLSIPTKKGLYHLQWSHKSSMLLWYPKHIQQ